MSLDYKGRERTYAIYSVEIKHVRMCNPCRCFCEIAFPDVHTSQVQDAIDQINERKLPISLRLCTNRMLRSRGEIEDYYPRKMLVKERETYAGGLLRKVFNTCHMWFYKKDFLDKVEDRIPGVSIRRF